LLFSDLFYPFEKKTGNGRDNTLLTNINLNISGHNLQVSLPLKAHADG